MNGLVENLSLRPLAKWHIAKAKGDLRERYLELHLFHFFYLGLLLISVLARMIQTNDEAADSC